MRMERGEIHNSQGSQNQWRKRLRKTKETKGREVGSGRGAILLQVLAVGLRVGWQVKAALGLKSLMWVRWILKGTLQMKRRLRPDPAVEGAGSHSDLLLGPHRFLLSFPLFFGHSSISLQVCSHTPRCPSEAPGQEFISPLMDSISRRRERAGGLMGEMLKGKMAELAQNLGLQRR